MDFIRNVPGFDLPLHKAQVSICYPGYPQPSGEETAAAFHHRVRRRCCTAICCMARQPDAKMQQPVLMAGVPLSVGMAGADLAP